ncbi:MAG: hypothetical protein R3C14_13345 [Caldilineaceae bacterium]
MATQVFLEGAADSEKQGVCVAPSRKTHASAPALAGVTQVFLEGGG